MGQILELEVSKLLILESKYYFQNNLFLLKSKKRNGNVSIYTYIEIKGYLKVMSYVFLSLAKHAEICGHFNYFD